MRKILFSLLVFLISSMGAYAQEAFIGEIRCVAFNFAPRGWALCNGQILPINQNQALFSLLGTTYGGDGRVTFALPDLRGRVPIGVGQGSGLSNNIVQGERGGSETATLSIAEMPLHTHATKVSTSVATTNSPGLLGQPADLGLNPVNVYVEGGGNLTVGSSTAPAGGSQSHNNMMPYLGLNWIICLQGIFPSRN